VELPYLSLNTNTLSERNNPPYKDDEPIVVSSTTYSEIISIKPSTNPFPGARFGPRAIRAASARQTPLRGFNTRANLNPYRSWATILDCGDIPITPFDNALALRQVSEAFSELGSRPSLSNPSSPVKLLALGGDHSIALPKLRSLSKLHNQPITVLHLDAHLDTWSPAAYDSSWLSADEPTEAQQSSFTHGSMFWLAWKEGLIANNSVHAGLRTRLQGVIDHEDDTQQGWVRIASDAIDHDELGPGCVAKLIMETIGVERPVYLSVDIDVLDPGLAPGTGGLT